MATNRWLGHAAETAQVTTLTVGSSTNGHTFITTINGKAITHEDVGSESKQPNEGDRNKAAVSDAFKRAAVKFGVGRYLYRLGMKWVPYDEQMR